MRFKVGDQVKVKGTGPLKFRVELVTERGVFGYYEGTTARGVRFVPLEEVEEPPKPKAVPGRGYTWLPHGITCIVHGFGTEDGRIFRYYTQKPEDFNPDLWRPCW